MTDPEGDKKVPQRPTNFLFTFVTATASCRSLTMTDMRGTYDGVDPTILVQPNYGHGGYELALKVAETSC